MRGNHLPIRVGEIIALQEIRVHTPINIIANLIAILSLVSIYESYLQLSQMMRICNCQSSMPQSCYRIVFVFQRLHLVNHQLYYDY